MMPIAIRLAGFARLDFSLPFGIFSFTWAILPTGK